MANPQTLIEKIQALPPEGIAEVESFVEFIAAKARRRAALGRLLEIAPALEAAGVPPMTDEEIQAEIDPVETGTPRGSSRDFRIVPAS